MFVPLDISVGNSLPYQQLCRLQRTKDGLGTVYALYGFFVSAQGEGGEIFIDQVNAVKEFCVAPEARV
jgi:hypothetical protein